MAKGKIQQADVIHAAIRLADAHGLDHVTLKKVAEELNIQTPSLYNHIKGLSGLYNLLALRGLNELKKALLHAAAGESGDDALRSMGRAYLNFAASHPGLYESTQWVNKWEDRQLGQVSDEIIELVTKVMSAYQLNDSDTTHIIRTFRSMLHGFASLGNHGGFGNPLPLTDSFEAALDILVAGIHKKYK